MRIALVTESFVPDSSPAAHLSRRTVDGLISRGHEVVVLTEGRGQASYRGAQVFRATRLTPASVVRQVLALARPDLVHLVQPGRLGAKAAGAAGRLSLAVVSPQQGEWQPGIDTTEHHPGLRDERMHDRWARAHHPDGGCFVVGYVGTVERGKVVSRLERIARLPGCRLVVVGTGPETDRLRTAGAKLVGSAVGLERARAVASLDALVQPRKKEPYAPAVHQALASGVPVVAFGTGAATEVVRHGVNGLLVDPERGAKTLARSVAQLAASPSLHQLLTENARDSLPSRDWDEAVAELVDTHYRTRASGRRMSAAV